VRTGEQGKLAEPGTAGSSPARLLGTTAKFVGGKTVNQTIVKVEPKDHLLIALITLGALMTGTQTPTLKSPATDGTDDVRLKRFS